MLSQELLNGKSYRLDVMRDGTWCPLRHYSSSAWCASQIRKQPTRRYRIVKLDQYTGEEISHNIVEPQLALF